MFTPIQFKTATILIVLNLFAVANVFGLGTNLTVGDLGRLIGSEETTAWTGRTIYSFRGIPYAEPPTGDLRFRPPVKITSWNGTLDARECGAICPQNVDSVTRLLPVDEDCLTLNVYVPKVENGNTKLPVMVWIFGGAFVTGNSMKHQPYYLLEEDIILVGMQFRLGLLGLLSLQTDEIPGNVQFMDQVMAMRWVQDNIVYFGGDPGRVTLFGQSSGAAAVNLHQVSPLSRGLFHQAIIQSGSFSTPRVMDYDPLRTATRIGEIVGCNQTDTTELAACFKALDVQTILDGYNSYVDIYTAEGLDSIGGDRAVIQTAGTQRFLEEDPRTLIARGEFTQVPMIGGVTKHDGTIFLLEYYYRFFLPLGFTNDTEFLQYNMTPYIVSTLGIDDASGGISQTLIRDHFDEEDTGSFDKMVPGLTDATRVTRSNHRPAICYAGCLDAGEFFSLMVQILEVICGLFLFKAGVFKMIQTNSRLQPSYLYSFAYFDSTIETGSDLLPFEMGITHAAELRYLFPTAAEMSDKDLAVAKKMVSLWTSFAITGEPVADGKTWEPMTTPFGPYLIIEDEFHDGRNFLNELTIASKDGMTAVERSSAVFTYAPHLITVSAASFWSIVRII